MVIRPRILVLSVGLMIGAGSVIPRRAAGQEAPRPPDAVERTILGAGSTLVPGAISQRALPPPPENFPFGYGSSLPPGTSLTPEQMEALRAYEDRLAELAREVEDPALRATALNLVARSKIVSRQLEQAHEDLADASRAALQLQPGLVRDLRLMAIVTNLVLLAHEQVVEAVPNNPPIADLAGQVRRMPMETRKVWLDRALQEWQSASKLAASITNPTYRNEKLAEVIQGESADSQKIGRDASLAGITRFDLEGLTPDLLAYADRVLQQASLQAEKIDRPVWNDKVLAEAAVAAARSNQYIRALSIARRIPRPVPKAEVLVRTAEEMARQAARLRERYVSGLDRDWTALEADMNRARSTAPAPPGPLPDFGFGREDVGGDVLLRLDSLSSLVDAIRLDSAQLHVQFEHEYGVLRSENVTPTTTDLVQRCDAIGRDATSLQEGLFEFRTKLSRDLDRARGLMGEERQAAIAAAVPRLDDPAVVKLREQTQALTRDIEGVMLPIDQAATRAFNEAARTVASIPYPDPRTLTTHLLIDSLVRVGRFDDARAGTRMFADPELRYFVLGEIAENQGRRGLAPSAARWIESEVPEDRQAALYRRVTQGVLNTVNQLRAQTMTAPAPPVPPGVTP